ncbi:hypothetical protein Rhe02_75180 [Rhizocola hellebori]|uniref:Uncharacterized protein n=1 Tax=Rhizocola hellebori TaxID=1392758 RepID=A0A8J3QEV3_9ACTN|nr:hypothetical protein Rhe02_75180 [Rhizocola hellebori]
MGSTSFQRTSMCRIQPEFSASSEKARPRWPTAEKEHDNATERDCFPGGSRMSGCVGTRRVRFLNAATFRGGDLGRGRVAWRIGFRLLPVAAQKC